MTLTVQKINNREHSPLLHATSLVTRTPNLYQSRRQNRVLFIERESGSWLILEGDRLRHFLKLQRPMTVREFLNIENAMTVRQREAFLLELYGHGMVEIAGKSYFNYEKLWKKPQAYPTFLCLHMTEKCNLACTYCQADALPSGERMPVQTAMKIVERLLTENPPETFTIDFHGGEPLLEYENMMKVIRHAKEVADTVGKKPVFMVQTNGTALSPERVQGLKDEGVLVGVSLDGPGEVHDKQRFTARGKGSFDRVWGNAQKAIEMGLNTGMLAVIHDPRDYLTTSRWFREQGFRSYRINYSSSIGRAPKELQFPAGREEAFARYWLEMVQDSLDWSRENNEHLNISDINNKINNLTTKSRPFMCYRSPCGVGNSVLGFGTDGGIFACEEMASLEYFRVGNIHDESVSIKDLVDHNPILQDLQRRTVDNIPKCSTCHLKRICSGGCTSKTFAKYGTVWRESPMCGFYLIVYEELMWMLHDNPDMVENLGYAGVNSPKFSKHKKVAGSSAGNTDESGNQAGELLIHGTDGSSLDVFEMVTT